MAWEPVSRSHRGCFCRAGMGLLIAASMTCGLTAQAQNQRAERQKGDRQILGKQVEQLLEEQALPALQQGYGDYFFATLVPLVEQMNGEQLASLEEFAKQQGVESIKSEFAAELIKRLEQGLIDLGQIERRDLAVFILSGIEGAVREQYTEITQKTVMQKAAGLPEPGHATADLFWEVHVLSNRFENLLRLANWAATMAGPHYARALKANDAETIARLEPLNQLIADLRNSYRNLVLNAAEYRLENLNRSVAALQVEKDFEQRLLAAWAFEDNARLLLEFLETADQAELDREVLKSPGLREHVERQLALGLDYGKDVMEKSQLLRLGCFWWLRGRYGAGPLANGLLKDISAMQSEEQMFGLYMPVLPRFPICSRLPEGYRLSGHDRRHYQTWAVEYRPRVRSGSVDISRTVKIDQRASQKGDSSRFW